jgi:hypothetical protein
MERNGSCQTLDLCDAGYTGGDDHKATVLDISQPRVYTHRRSLTTCQTEAKTKRKTNNDFQALIGNKTASHIRYKTQTELAGRTGRVHITSHTSGVDEGPQ